MTHPGRHEPLAAGHIDRWPAAVDDRGLETGQPRLDGDGEPGGTATDDEQISDVHGPFD